MQISMCNLKMIQQHTEHEYSYEKAIVSIRGMRSNKWTLYIVLHYRDEIKNQRHFGCTKKMIASVPAEMNF